MLDLSHLPDDVRARTRVLVNEPPRASYVLYWMRVAARDHENAALDAAVSTANALGVAAFVYHGVSERYPYASDRHHTFILEGARDVAAGLRRRGIAYALHVERPGERGAFLRKLAEEASVVVTEDAPMPPLAEWTRRLAAHLAQQRVPFITVDASCVVPMPLLQKRFERAYAFRSATRAMATAALARPWKDVDPARSLALPNLPFAPVEAESLDDRAIARLVGACAIDHSVGPVRTSRGGSAAGYARWDAFVASGLASYAQRRNDAAVDGTSRLSPWLHYGHVSALRIAREASAPPGSTGHEKFLDELLVWRELAWHFASHTPNLASLDVLPSWARATLSAHAHDARVPLSAEQLERGRTGDALWDLVQRSLIHGELHNNVRMTWGKALPAWTASPEAARRALVDLNHRYALDGRDPASYGGLYWCLGLFDRPFLPEVAVLGAVRPRPTAPHARRLDMERYAARVSRPARAVGRVAVVGAGVAGLACARTLLDHGVDVVVFDEQSAVGGRLAGPESHQGHSDLGAQYFTVKDPRFDRAVRSWLEDSIVERWHGRIRALPRAGAALLDTPALERLVGTPHMGAIALHLAEDVTVRLGHRIEKVERRGARLALAGTVGPPPTRVVSPTPPVAFGEFDVLVVCATADRALELALDVSPQLARSAAQVGAEPCLSLGFVPEGAALTDLPFDGLFVGRDGDEGRAVAWLARDSSKPKRGGDERWVVHAAPEWSRLHFREPTDVIEAGLLHALARTLGLSAIESKEATLLRWAAARPVAALDAGALFDDESKVGLGGDWCAGGRVEGAFLSGIALAGRVLGLPAEVSLEP
ncbi:MAG: photolyase FAD-binding protein [Polyangiaceae bacterium]|jgi:photolyase PhrII|nr:photolyase FAD-binding protein [Polyangiaceae bacterium]